jgi:hypothetical protein
VISLVRGKIRAIKSADPTPSDAPDLVRLRISHVLETHFVYSCKPKTGPILGKDLKGRWPMLADGAPAGPA